MLSKTLFTLDNKNKESGISIPNSFNAILVLENGQYWFCNVHGNQQTYAGHAFTVEGGVTMETLLDPLNNGKVLFYMNKIEEIHPVAENYLINESRIIVLANKPKNIQSCNFNIAYDLPINEIETTVVSKDTKCYIYKPNDKNSQIEISDILEKIATIQYVQDINCTNEKEYAIRKLAKQIPDKYQGLINCMQNTLYLLHSKRKTIAIIDFGVSAKLLEFLSFFFNVITVPRNTSYHNLAMIKVDGVVISNAPNYESISNELMDNIREIIAQKIPLLGIQFGACLIANIYNLKIKKRRPQILYNNYLVIANKNAFIASQEYYYNIQPLDEMSMIEHVMYDEDRNISGYKIKNAKVIGYNFTFADIVPDHLILLNEFSVLMSKKI